MLKVKFAAISLFGLIASSGINAQNLRPLSFSVLANATTLPTQTGQIFQSLHPGFSVGTSFRYNHSPKNQLGQTIKLSYNYHQFVHHSVQLYSELEYKRLLSQRINIAGAFGAGYVHLFSGTQAFHRNSNGEYRAKSNWGRPQVMGTFALGAGYLLNPRSENPLEIFTRYQFWLQAPFVRQYVPVLPNTSLHLGLNIPVFKRRN